MPVIELSTVIRAPRERVFDLARSIEAHQDSATGTEERAVAGVTKGLIGMDGEVTWEARHFGVRQRLTVKAIKGRSLPIKDWHEERSHRSKYIENDAAKPESLTREQYSMIHF